MYVVTIGNFLLVYSFNVQTLDLVVFSRLWSVVSDTDTCFLFWVGVTMEMQNLVQRRIYPFLLMVVVLMGILSFQIRQFKRLYEHIKNDKWVLLTNVNQ